MSAEKLSSDEVPKTFLEWLLDMGYPMEKIPSIDKIEQKCRGQYYMVWRSLMEHVRPRDEIRKKRLNVFCDDVQLCKKKNVFNERDSSVVIPEQLLLWNQLEEVQKKVVNAEAHVTQTRQNLNQLMDKVSSRICQRDMSRKKVEDKQRRVWLLRQVSAELEVKKTNLEETRNIAHSLCDVEDDADLQSKVDTCLSLLQSGPPPAPNPGSLGGNARADELEEKLASISRVRGDALWKELMQRRAVINTTLAHANTLHTATRNAKDHRWGTRAALAHTAALHCTLALEAMKTRAHVRQTSARLAARLEDLNEYLSGVACELLVLRCERASAAARVRSLRATLDELASDSGVFENARECGERPVSHRQIATIDKAIENTRDELKRLIVALAATERKVLGVTDALAAVFDSLRGGAPADARTDIQLDLPQESAATICQFYEEEREKRRSQAELSLDFDTSDCSFDNTIDFSNPRFIDELKFYLKKFNLEKNRQLVIESGEKVWIFETLHSCLERLHAAWLSSELAPAVCPSASLAGNLRRIVADELTKEALERTVKELGNYRRLTFDMDITKMKEEEDAAADKIKKQIGENLQSLQKSMKTLELGEKNLQLWQDDGLKQCISSNRTVNGKSYKEYEAFYIESLQLNA